MLGLGPDKNEVFVLEYWDANKTREKVEIFVCGESKQRSSILNATAPMPLNHSALLSRHNCALFLMSPNALEIILGSRFARDLDQLEANLRREVANCHFTSQISLQLVKISGPGHVDLRPAGKNLIDRTNEFKCDFCLTVLLQVTPQEEVTGVQFWRTRWPLHAPYCPPTHHPAIELHVQQLKIDTHGVAWGAVLLRVGK